MTRLPAAIPRLAVALAALLLCGCLGSLQREYPEIRYHTLEAPRGPAAQAPAVQRSLALKAFTASVGPAETGFLLRHGDTRVERDFHNRFIAPPADLLQDATATSLSTSGLFTDVRRVDSDAHVDWVMTGHVLRLEGDFGEKPPVADLAVQFHLAPRDADAARFTATYEQRVALGSATPEALAKGWDEALGLVLAQLRADLSSHLAAQPAPATP